MTYEPVREIQQSDLLDLVSHVHVHDDLKVDKQDYVVHAVSEELVETDVNHHMDRSPDNTDLVIEVTTVRRIYLHRGHS